MSLTLQDMDISEMPTAGSGSAMSTVVATPTENVSLASELKEKRSNGKRVTFHDDALTEEFNDTGLWAHDPNETAKHMIEKYRSECSALKVRPITKLLEQLERLDGLDTPIDTLDLKGVRLDSRSCEVLEVVLSRMQMVTLDLERCNLEDEGMIAVCEMVEFYGCASRLIMSANTRLRPRAWLTVGRMLKKSPFITTIDVSYCALEEQPLTLLLRSVRANCCLQVLKMIGNNLAGKGTFILMAAMKFNENLQELWLGSNHLGPEDGQHLGSILRTNHTLKVLDVRENNLQDAGVRYISAGVAEQQEGLLILNLTSNSIGQEGFHHISAMLPCSKSLRELNMSHNKCGDNGLFTLKLGLLANRSIEKLNLSNTKMTCEGAIALAEVLAESKHITDIDLKENDIRVAGLMALQLGHRMNHTLVRMETPKAYRVDQRDRPLIKDMLTEIDKYCARNLQEREERREAERRRQHEAQHAKQGGAKDEKESFTAGENAIVEDEAEKEIDPSLVGSLDDVYPDEPGAEMNEEVDPFKKAPVMDDHEKPASLQAMERSLDAMAVLTESDEGPASPATPDVDMGSLNLTIQAAGLEQRGEEGEGSSLDTGTRQKLLPDVVGGVSSQQPDVAEQSPQANMPLDLGMEAQCSVDLLEDAGHMREDSPPQPLDLTDGLTNISQPVNS